MVCGCIGCFKDIKIRTERNGFQMVSFQPSVRGILGELETLPNPEVMVLFVKGGERVWVIPRAWGSPSRVGQSADLPGPGRMKGPNSPAGCRRQCRHDSPVCPAAQAWPLPLRAQDHQEDVLSERVSLRDRHT